MDLGSSRFGIGGRVEELERSNDNPSYQQFGQANTTQQLPDGILTLIDIFSIIRSSFAFLFFA